MSLADPRRCLDKLEGRRREASALPWVWIVTYPGESREQKVAEMIAAGEMQPGQSCINWQVISPLPGPFLCVGRCGCQRASARRRRG